MPSKKALDALNSLLSGNAEYLRAKTAAGDVSPDLRERLRDEGQKPYAVIVACSDSRVVPEDIFMCGLGELFVIRVAGNVIGETQVASIVYALKHLGAPLVMVLGHTHCGAIDAVLKGCDEEALQPISYLIEDAVGDERDPEKASKLNALAALRGLKAVPPIAFLEKEGNLLVMAALYHIGTGRVEILDEENA